MTRRLFLLSLAMMADRGCAGIVNTAEHVPAPTPPANEIQLPGTWELHWGGTIQTCYFSKDGKYDSCRFGGGKWYSEIQPDGSVSVRFNEGAAQYQMAFERDGFGHGVRLHFLEDGEVKYGDPVTVRMRRTGNGEKRP